MKRNAETSPPQPRKRQLAPRPSADPANDPENHGAAAGRPGAVRAGSVPAGPASVDAALAVASPASATASAAASPAAATTRNVASPSVASTPISAAPAAAAAQAVALAAASPAAAVQTTSGPTAATDAGAGAPVAATRPGTAVPVVHSPIATARASVVPAAAAPAGAARGLSPSVPSGGYIVPPGGVPYGPQCPIQQPTGPSPPRGRGSAQGHPQQVMSPLPPRGRGSSRGQTPQAMGPPPSRGRGSSRGQLPQAMSPSPPRGRGFARGQPSQGPGPSPLSGNPLSASSIVPDDNQARSKIRRPFSDENPPPIRAPPGFGTRFNSSQPGPGQEQRDASTQQQISVGITQADRDYLIGLWRRRSDLTLEENLSVRKYLQEAGITRVQADGLAFSAPGAQAAGERPPNTAGETSGMPLQRGTTRVGGARHTEFMERLRRRIQSEYTQYSASVQQENVRETYRSPNSQQSAAGKEPQSAATTPAIRPQDTVMGGTEAPNPGNVPAVNVDRVIHARGSGSEPMTGAGSPISASRRQTPGPGSEHPPTQEGSREAAASEQSQSGPAQRPNMSFDAPMVPRDGPYRERSIIMVRRLSEITRALMKLEPDLERWGWETKPDAMIKPEMLLVFTLTDLHRILCYTNLERCKYILDTIAEVRPEVMEIVWKFLRSAKKVKYRPLELDNVNKTKYHHCIIDGHLLKKHPLSARPFNTEQLGKRGLTWDRPHCTSCYRMFNYREIWFCEVPYCRQRLCNQCKSYDSYKQLRANVMGAGRVGLKKHEVKPTAGAGTQQTAGLGSVADNPTDLLRADIHFQPRSGI